MREFFANRFGKLDFILKLDDLVVHALLNLRVQLVVAAILSKEEQICRIESLCLSLAIVWMRVQCLVLP